MQEIIANNDAKSQVFHDYLAQTYVPALQSHLSSTEQYLQQETKHIAQVLAKSDELIEAIVDKKTTFSKTVKQLNEKIQSEQDKLKKAEQYKKGKKDELSAVQKTIDSISTAMKESVSKIDAKEINKVSDLPQGMDQFMAKLFTIVYNEDQNKFQWSDFRKKVFDQEKGTDFQSRLANFQFKGVSAEKEGFLYQMKADPQFQKVYQDPKYTRAFLDIADWIHFAVSGVENQKKRDASQSEYTRIDKEFGQRRLELESLQKTYDFWLSQLNYAEDQLVYLNQFQPNAKQIENEILNSTKQLDQHIIQVMDGIDKVNKLMVPNI